MRYPEKHSAGISTRRWLCRWIGLSLIVRRRIGGEPCVRTAPSDKTIHHVHEDVLVGLTTGLTQLTASGLEQSQDRVRALAFREKALHERPELPVWVAGSQGLIDGVVDAHGDAPPPEELRHPSASRRFQLVGRVLDST